MSLLECIWIEHSMKGTLPIQSNLEWKHEYKIADRIDIQVEIQPVKFDELASTENGESSAAIRERVIKARRVQQERYKGEPGIHCNAQMNSKLLHEYAWPDADGMAKPNT